MQAMRIENLTKVYKRAKKEVPPALSDLSLVIEQGEVFGFLGPNGAGKTTTIKILVNLIFPTTGMAWIFDKKCIDHECRKHIGFLPETPMFYDYLTLEEFLWFSGHASGIRHKQLKMRVDELIRTLDMERARKIQIRKYSKGMIQRSGLAQALIGNPQILVLDEPMSGLDPIGRNDFVGLIRRLKDEGKTIFFSSHVLSDIENLCDRVGILVKGELKNLGSVSEMLRESSDGFLVRIKGMDHEGGQYLEQQGIQVKTADGSTAAHVPKDKLMDAMGIIKARNAEIISVDTKRKSLEDIFLDVVRNS